MLALLVVSKLEAATAEHLQYRVCQGQRAERRGKEFWQKHERLQRAVVLILPQPGTVGKIEQISEIDSGAVNRRFGKVDLGAGGPFLHRLEDENEQTTNKNGILDLFCNLTCFVICNKPPTKVKRDSDASIKPLV